jgi:hypothetical protein
MIHYYCKGLFGVFARLTACIGLRALRLQGGGEGPVGKWPLAAGEGTEVDCCFNGLARASSQEPFMTSYRFLCNPIDSKYDSLHTDTVAKCLANEMQE